MLRETLVAAAWGGLVLAGCSGGTTSGTGASGGQAGATTSSEGGGGKGGGGQGGGGQGGAGAQGGGGPDGSACGQCMVPPPGSECATSLAVCQADEAACKIWSQCVDACVKNNFTEACFEACKLAHPEAEALFTPVLACTCAACAAPCAPMCM